MESVVAPRMQVRGNDEDGFADAPKADRDYQGRNPKSKNRVHGRHMRSHLVRRILDRMLVVCSNSMSELSADVMHCRSILALSNARLATSHILATTDSE